MYLNYNELISIVIKSIVAAFVLFMLARLMGKKQIAQLSFFDYVVGISIGSIAAAVSVDKRITIINGIVSMIIWAILPIIFSYFSINSIKARGIIDGKPVILIQNGKIIEKNLVKLKLTVNDLLEELRIKDVFNFIEVEYAVMETNGKLSVLKKASQSNNQGLFANVIIDGRMMRENMKQFGIDEMWLNNELNKNNVFETKEVLLAVCDSNHMLYIDRKNSDPEVLTIFQ